MPADLEKYIEKLLDNPPMTDFNGVPVTLTKYYNMALKDKIDKIRDISELK